MFKGLKGKIEAIKSFAEDIRNATNDHYLLTARSFNDPIAMKTEWRPAKQGGSNFKTYSLVITDENRIEFKITTGLKLLYLLIIIMLSGVAALFSFFIVPVVLIISLFLFYTITKPIIFDRKQGCFWIGRKPSKTLLKSATSKKSVFFEQIHALQLISEHISSSSNNGHRSDYRSYELNLVLKDGQRINVVDHGNKEALQKDAATLAQFLNKPVWDAI